MKRTIVLVTVAVTCLAADRFDVASIKMSTTSGSPARTQRLPGGRFQATGISLAGLVRYAYGIHELQLVGAQGWMSSERFDITAVLEGAPETVPDEQVQRMVQVLLAERFQLKVRKESKEMPMLALVVSKNGAKVKPLNGPPSMARPGEGLAVFRTTTIKSLCSALTFAAERVVVDETGLTGSYDIAVEYTPERLNGAAPAPGGIGILAAAQAQLGLKLEARRGPVETILIESAQRPTSN